MKDENVKRSASHTTYDRAGEIGAYPVRSGAASAAAWASLTQIFSQLLSLALIPYLARSLTKSDFGLIAAMQIVVAFGNLLCEFGTGAAVIQKKVLTREYFSTSVWLNTLLGLGLSVVTFVLSEQISALLNFASLSSLLGILCLQFLVLAPTISLQAIMRRVMDYRRVFIIESATVISYVFVVVALIESGVGVAAVVYAQVISSAAKLVLYVACSPERPRLCFSTDASAEIVKYASGLGGFNLVNFWARRADQVIIGKALGEAALGIYSVAYRIMMLPLTQVTYSITNVLHPVLAPMQDDERQLRDLVLKYFSVIGLITFPIMAAIWGARYPLVEIILGPDWVEVAELLGVFAVVGALQSVVALVSVVYTVTKQTRLFFAIGCLNTLVVVASFFLGVGFGIKGVAWAYAAANLLMLFVHIWFCMRVLKARVLDWVLAVYPLVIGFGVSCFSSNAISLSSNYLFVIAVLAISMATFAGIGFFFYRPILRAGGEKFGAVLRSLRVRWRRENLT